MKHLIFFDRYNILSERSSGQDKRYEKYYLDKCQHGAEERNYEPRRHACTAGITGDGCDENGRRGPRGPAKRRRRIGISLIVGLNANRIAVAAAQTSPNSMPE